MELHSAQQETLKYFGFELVLLAGVARLSEEVLKAAQSARGEQ